MGGTAFGADPFTDLEILEFGVLAATVVAELARREEGVDEHNLCAIPFCEVFQLFNKVYEPEILDFLPVFPLEKLKIQCFKTNEIVFLTQFMSESPVPIVPLVLDCSVRSVPSKARRVSRL